MTGLREAARALVSLILDTEPPEPAWHALQAEAMALRAALAAPSPGLDEVRAMLERLYSEGFDDGMRWGEAEHFESEIDDERRDPLIARLLAMWEGR